MNEPVHPSDRFFPTTPDQNPDPNLLSPLEQAPNTFLFLHAVVSETHELGRRLQIPQDDINSMTLTGARARILGNSLQLSAALGAELQNELQYQRIDRTFEKLAELDQQINYLSRTLQLEPLVLTASQPIENGSQLTFDQLFYHLLQQFDQQLQELEKKVGISLPTPVVQIDPNFSINQKIDHIETTLTQMSDRLDRLEQWVGRFLVQAQPTKLGEAEHLLKLPQMPEEYRDRISSETLISELAESFPEQFNQLLGVLKWEAEGARYQMTIYLHQDDSREISVERQVGEDYQIVLTARITPDRVIEIEQSQLNPDITEYQVNALRHQRGYDTRTMH